MGSSLLCSQYSTCGWRVKAAILCEDMLSGYHRWASRSPGLTTEFCHVSLGDVAAAGHGDGAEWRAQPRQVCGRIVREENAAGQIKHAQVHGADGQILNCHVRHLRQCKRIRESIVQSDVIVAERLAAPVSSRPSAAWSALCSRRRWL